MHWKSQRGFKEQKNRKLVAKVSFELNGYRQIGIYEEKYMIRIRPYKASDVDTILSWCQDEKAFYQWTAGVLGNYPITQNEFCFVESLMPFTAFDETGIVGFLH